MLFVVLLVVGCGVQKVAPQGANTALPASLAIPTPAVRDIHIQTHDVPDAVPGGRVWLDVGPELNIPAEAWNNWRVGITDGAGRNQVLGKLSQDSVDRGHFCYALPEDLTAGNGSIWLSTGDDQAAAGSVQGPVNIQPLRATLDSQLLGIQFKVPRGWLSYEIGDSISLSNGPDRPAQPIEEIDITRGLVKWTPDRSQVEKTETTMVAGYPARRVYVLQQSANGTASWKETHTIVQGIDIALLYRPPLTAEMTDAYDFILQSLSFK